MFSIKIKDETIGGEILNEILLSVESERITLRELISARVVKEVELYNQQTGTLFKGLVQPGESEQTERGFVFRKHKNIDAEEQVYVALDAFAKNGFFVLIDNQQVQDLDQEVLVGKETSVAFVKLTPLVGG